MGNQNSKKTEENTQENEHDIANMKFENVISYVAAKYITQANFRDLENLHKPDYCNKLVILTSNTIKHFLNDIEIDYLDQRTKQGEDINKMEKSSVLYLDKDNLDRLDVSSHVRKKRMCIGIAKFYVRIAHIFAAIAMTINPKYTYIDENGLEKSVDFKERAIIPAGKKITTSYQNLCQSRINAIKPRQNTENGIVLKVKNCDMNKKINSMVDGVEVPVVTTETKNLFEETGIPELETLYYDEYNFNDGKYVGITEEGKQVYMNDLEKFYIAFTGGECFPNKCGVTVQNMPGMSDAEIGQYFSSKIGEVIYAEKRGDSVYIKFKKTEDRDKLLKIKNFKFNDIILIIKKWEITKFSEIPLKDFHTQELCKNKDSPWQKSYSGNTNDKLFKTYAEHIKSMIANSQKIEKSLLNIIKQLFSFWVDPQKKQKVLTINPELNNKKLDELTVKTRNDILSLYIGCEEDFQKGLSLFEGIVKSKMIETSMRRIKSFEKQADEITVDTTEMEGGRRRNKKGGLSGGPQTAGPLTTEEEHAEQLQAQQAWEEEEEKKNTEAYASIDSEIKSPFAIKIQKHFRGNMGREKALIETNGYWNKEIGPPSDYGVSTIKKPCMSGCPKHALGSQYWSTSKCINFEGEVENCYWNTKGGTKGGTKKRRKNNKKLRKSRKKR